MNMDIGAKDVQRLRQAAGVGMMDARRALVEAEGDFDKARELLRVWGLAKADKRAEREATEGVIGIYIHYQSDRPVTGVLVELACETDFVAKSSEFRQVADGIAMHVAWSSPRWITTEDVDPEELEKERQIITLQAAEEGKPDNVIPRIVEGKLRAFYQANVLNEQKFVNEQQFEGTVGAMVSDLAAKMGENVRIRRIARMKVGE
jgi:elongation factor Ts